MTMTLSIVSHKNYNFTTNKSFVIFLTFKLIACFIDGFTLRMKYQSIAYLLNGSEHLDWILNVEDEVHSIWVMWTSGLQECKGNFIFQSRADRASSRQWKEACPGRDPALGRCDLAWDENVGGWKSLILFN